MGERAHEVAGGGVFGYDVQMVEQACPGNEAGFVGDDVEVREQELHGGCAEEVAAGYFEMRGVGKGGADAVGIGVGGHDDGHAAVGFEGGVAFGKADGKTVFVGYGTLAQRAGGSVVRAAQSLFVV